MNATRLFLSLLTTATVILVPLAAHKPASATEQSNNQLMNQALQPGVQQKTMLLAGTRSPRTTPPHNPHNIPNVPAPLPGNFFRLPPEVAYHIFDKLSPQDKNNLKRTSREMRALVEAHEEHRFQIFADQITHHNSL